MKHLLLICCLFWANMTFAQQTEKKEIPKRELNKPEFYNSKFEQLGEILPTPNNFRTGSGAPGHEYWQQKADYKIKVSLDDEKQTMKGSETVTYINNSPNDLTFIWLQLDQNLFEKNSDTPKSTQNVLTDDGGYGLYQMAVNANSNGGFNITACKDGVGKDLKYTVNKTMMRIELPTVLKGKGGKFTFSVDWNFNIVDCKKTNARSGYEYFAKDNNYLYEIAQWFPRMAVYDDVNGWQHKQFLGQGEFALTFGDYEVAITVPADHIVGATGELQNMKEVLTAEQLKRWEQAKTAKDPILIVNQTEAEVAEKTKATKTKTWVYKAQNVRDFAWVSSRKFIWDAYQIDLNNKKVWAMSYYPKEGNPLWGHYSTRVVAHTLRVYSKYTIDYPYPVAISVHGPQGGMEYPMICFNGGRPREDGTIPDQTRNGMVSVIIHEVGHNFFPMIINSDERQWTWMDEGLNSFCQYLAEVEIPQQEWAKKDYPLTYPSRRGPAKGIIDYMKSEAKYLEPIMSNSEGVQSLGNNAYGKPAIALNILRETVMGKELFDYAFKEYSKRWAFKHPMPADFFRTMEDASAVDLDWFWRGWFYGTEPCDISIGKVDHFRMFNPDGSEPTASTNAPFKMKLFKKDMLENLGKNMGRYGLTLNLTEQEKQTLSSDKYYYTVNFKNVGGLIMPVLVEIKYKDGTSEMVRIPAEIWRKSPYEVNKSFITSKEVVEFILDPKEETADIDVNNNKFPRQEAASEFKEFKEKTEK